MKTKLNIRALLNRTFKSQHRTKQWLYYGKGILYENGISMFRIGGQKRKPYFNPIVCIIINLILIIRDISSLVIDEERYSIIVGDLTFKWKLKKEWIGFMFCMFSYLILSEVCHLWYYHKKRHNYLIETNWVDSHRTITLSRREKLWKNLLKFYLDVNIPVTFGTVSLTSLYVSTSLPDFLIFGVPWSIYVAFVGYQSIRIFVYQVLYFKLVSKYFRNELKIINYRLILLLLYENNSEVVLNRILKDIDKTHRCLEGTDQFWSKYIAINWVTLSFCISFEIFIIIYGKLGIVIWFAMIIDLFVFIVFMWFLTTSGTDVYNEANETPKHLNNIFCRLNSSLNLKLKFKVI